MSIDSGKKKTVDVLKQLNLISFMPSISVIISENSVILMETSIKFAADTNKSKLFN